MMSVIEPMESWSVVCGLMAAELLGYFWLVGSEKSKKYSAVSDSA